jgi:hypothetical protein
VGVNVQDHFSHYVWLVPLLRKTAINVADALRDLFRTVGVPVILQSDNGGEFRAIRGDGEFHVVQV